MNLHQRFVEAARAVQSSSRYAQGLMRHGRCPDTDDLIGWGFRGYNTFFGAQWSGLTEFMKVFFKDSFVGHHYGYNLVVKQNGIESGLELAVESGDYVVQGAFHAYLVNDKDTPKYAVHRNALLLDYGGHNPHALGPVIPIEKNRISEGKWLRDYIVQPFDTPDILLGRPYLRIPGINFYVPLGYFVLKRELKLESTQSCDRIRAHFARR